MKYVDEIFDDWVDSMDTTTNRREHIISQKIFCIAFGIELLKEEEKNTDAKILKAIELATGLKYNSLQSQKYLKESKS